MIVKGFKFGMLLQIAIGPVCIFIFQSRIKYSFSDALAGVLGVALTDGAEIALAIIGVGRIMEKNKTLKRFFGFFGAAVLMLFGINGMLSLFGISLLPALFPSAATGANIFVQAVTLALSNPLTIVFWAGVFATRIAQGDLKGSDLWFFGLGCVLSTLLFLSFVSAVGSVTHRSVPDIIVKTLNFVSSAAITLFGIKNLINAKKSAD